MPNITNHRSPKARAALCALVLLTGLFAMKALAGLKKPPEALDIPETPLAVEVTEARSREVQTVISGYGEVTALNTVALSPEVSGRVVALHPNLEEGEVIEKGELLFGLDTEALTIDQTTAERRLVTLKRNRDLLKKEYERTRRLFDTMKTGSLSDVETAEQAYNTARDSVDQLAHSLAETELNLKKSTVRAPFRARVKSVSIEMDQYLTAGTQVLTLADDALLEVAVPIKGDEAAMFLEFAKGAAPTTWFGPLVPKECLVSWNDSAATATGTLDRVVRYDAASRTVYVAVQMNGQSQEGFPITEGMFCRVAIPGKSLDHLIPLPSHAVTSSGAVRIDNNGRLKTVSVETAYTHDGFTYVSAGLDEGTRVITSRLASPLENALLSITVPKELASGGTR
ncbi:efflux RND transporter periplasmic adaptor subunit [Desulfoluna butyratoxydans]|uniref:Rnd efflux pump membrane fusion protein n=1 Tax=Desulfoluna butyratoxydans TaxID=231438 RepID=A0A4U8YPI8_9BACT|nr:efflux RND transporter periplasmic adaptor subunit [Desulfoluna butyratoxydans]VFQ43592.1 rnd efflux pump membrane fusion protein [Desulfoluna butyratoxydans]